MNILMYWYLFIFGLFIGSFLNVLADRLSRDETINGRSKCESCKHVLNWYDLLPIISYTLLRGKCRYCRASISLEYPGSEILTGVIFVLTYYLSSTYYELPYLHLVHIVIASIFVVVLLSDIRYQIIPDEMQIALAAMALWRFFLLGIDPQMSFFQNIMSVSFLSELGIRVVAGVAVMIPLLVIYLLTKGKGMGFGDVKFAFNMGLLLGIWPGALALYISFMIGGIVGIIFLLMKKGGLKSKIAFGPFLVIATYIVLFYQKDLVFYIQQLLIFH